MHNGESFDIKIVFDSFYFFILIISFEILIPFGQIDGFSLLNFYLLLFEMAAKRRKRAKKAHFHLTPIFLKYFFIHEKRLRYFNM